MNGCLARPLLRRDGFNDRATASPDVVEAALPRIVLPDRIRADETRAPAITKLIVRSSEEIDAIIGPTRTSGNRFFSRFKYALPYSACILFFDWNGGFPMIASARGHGSKSASLQRMFVSRLSSGRALSC